MFSAGQIMAGLGLSPGDFALAYTLYGVASIFIESHPDPDNAPSDGPNMIAFDKLQQLIETIQAFDKLAKAQLD